MGRHIQTPLGHTRLWRIHVGVTAILVSLALTAAACSGAAQGVGGGAPSNSPSSAIATDATPETVALATPTSTVTPVATPAPTISRPAPPAPAVSKAPVSKPPPPIGITFPAGSASGHPGQVATLAAHYTPGVLCSIVVHYKSGPSKAQGLGAKQTGPAGNVSWSWIIGTNTTRGQWPITVTCGSASAQSFINVV